MKGKHSENARARTRGREGGDCGLEGGKEGGEEGEKKKGREGEYVCMCTRVCACLYVCVCVLTGLLEESTEAGWEGVKWLRAPSKNPRERERGGAGGERKE